MAERYMSGDLRKGVVFELDGGVYKVIEFQHVKPGKGPAFVKVKIRNVMNSSVLEKTFNTTERFQGAEIERREMQYLYNDGELYHFMDNSTYEQTPINKEMLEDTLKYLKENMNVTVLSFKGKIFSIEPPTFVELKVTYTEPGFAGNTSGGGQTKPAELETGHKIGVPLFIEIDDVIRVDTRTDEYMERI